MTRYDKFCGWVPNPPAVEVFSQRVGTIQSVAGGLIGSADGVDIYLWQPLLELKPSWKRGAQAIGDCVAWGAELAATTLIAIQTKLGDSEFRAEVATEPIYGGARVESQGKDQDRGPDGTYGAAAAEWVEDWGILLREDYSTLTGSSDDDLRRYSGTKSKSWGRYGCGGQDDNGRLDGLARLSPVKAVAQVRTTQEAAAAIGNGYPVTVASMAGFGSMRRSSTGTCRRQGQWSHQMVVLGIRWVNGSPQFRLFNSWGKSASGPDPGIVHPAVSDCSWWITEADMAWILRTGDCWAFGDVRGFPARSIDWLKAASSWG